MIISQNSLLYAYVFYLVGRVKYRVDEQVLRRAIAQWFFMSAVTGRHAGSPETTTESDLARLRDAAWWSPYRRRDWIQASKSVSAQAMRCVET